MFQFSVKKKIYLCLHVLSLNAVIITVDIIGILAILVLKPLSVVIKLEVSYPIYRFLFVQINRKKEVFNL